MNDSSTNNSLSGPNPSSESLIPRSQNAFALVASLTGASFGKSTFNILTLFIDRQNSPELMRIKQKVKEIPRIEFQTLSEIGKHLQEYQSKIERYQCNLFSHQAFIKNEPESKQIQELEKLIRCVDEEKNNFGIGGEQSITRHANLINEHAIWTEEEAKKVQLRIRAICILRDKTEYWQGFWDAVNDHLLPDASIAAGTPAEPIAALVLWVTGLLVSSLIYDKSWEREKFLEVLDTWEDMLCEDYRMIMETKREIDSHHYLLKNAQGQWSSEVGRIWRMKKLDFYQGDTTVFYEEHLKFLKGIENKLSLTIVPVKQAFDLVYPFHGPGISVQRNTKNFCDDVPDALIYLTKLLTAKAIIHTSQQEQFQGNVYSLARIIYGRLEQIEALCTQWSKSINPGELAVFLEEGTEDFLFDAGQVIQGIKQILETGISDRKKGKALKERMESDRHLKSWDWKARPLVTSAGAMEVLAELKAIIRVINRVSVSTGTGTNMPSVEGLIVAQRSYVEFNHSNSLLEDFFRVLREEIQRGSITFPKSRETGTTEAKTSRSSWWRIGRRKKPEAPISGL